MFLTHSSWELTGSGRNEKVLALTEETFDVEKDEDAKRMLTSETKEHSH